MCRANWHARVSGAPAGKPAGATPADTPWDHGLRVFAEAEGLVGQAGAVLLRKLADQVGLTAALGSALARAGKFPLVDRGMALVSMAVAIVLGATSMNDIALLAHQEPVLGAGTVGYHGAADAGAGRSAHSGQDCPGSRARVRAHVWKLIRGKAGRVPRGCPSRGGLLAGWLVIDLDGTLITAHSEKQGAAPTFKKGYGFHPLGAWCANTARVRWRCCCGRATPGPTPSPIT